MADDTIRKLPEIKNPLISDLMLVVTDPASNPVNKKITIDNLNNFHSTSIQTKTDNVDVVFKQYDGTEVARIHDGANNTVNSSISGGSTLVGTATKGGFGFRRPVYGITPSATGEGDINIQLEDASGIIQLETNTTGGPGNIIAEDASIDERITLTLGHSGSLINVTGAAYDLNIKLPAIAAGEEGFFIDIAITTAFSGTNNLEVETNGTGGDQFFMYMNTAGTSGVDVDGGDVIVFTNDVPAGSLCRLICIKGGSAEQWIAEIMQPSGTAATTAAVIG